MDNKDVFLILSYLNQFQSRKVLIKKIYDSCGDLTDFFNHNKNTFPYKLSPKDYEDLGALRNEAQKIDLSKIKSSMDEKDISYLAYSENKYPSALKNISDPPFCLFYKGDLNLFSKKSVAIVGTRTPTPYGINITKKISSVFADLDIVVVSGLASGIDSCAHIGTLKNGKTIAVLGTGVDIIFPAENKDLFKKILDKGGLILSEYIPGTSSFPWNFPQRNRIISALAGAVIVVEGSLQSGSLITARFAIKQGKPLFALPGPINETMSNGPNILIKSKVAELFTSVNDVLEKISKDQVMQLNLELDKKEQNDLTSKQQEIYKLVESCPKDFDSLLDKTKLDISELITNLSILELKGYIEKTNDGNYVKI